ncbi:MAG: SprB repeat-containing protein, partial [Bacteroidetes bacterium]|nr:SprB repeat-containing protein [Bacteroidota bacterium]
MGLCPCQTYHWKLAIADASDCIYDSGVFIDFLACSNALTITPSQTNAGCSACTGTATVTLTNGVGPFTYSWSPAPGGGQGTATATGLCAGTYTCTINDALSCTAPFTQTFTIISSGSLTLSGTQTNISCFGSCTGSATTNIVTGTGPFTYSWAPSGGTAATANGLCAGTYTCTVTASGGCTATQTFNITSNPAITDVPSQVNVTCFGSCNGSATVVAAGGTGTYTYAWAPSGGTAATASALCAGSYTCTISSPAGCTHTQTFTITQPAAITDVPSQVNVTCNGTCNGSATVVAAGGTGTYTYAWAPSGGTAATASALCAGSYTCTISSPAGCTHTQSFTITQPPVITATPSQVNVTCNGTCNGSATVVAAGGTGTYTYSWAPSGGTAATASGLCAGSYTCTISSPAGCTITQTFKPAAITDVPSQVNVTCNASCNGSATVVAAGGTGTYTYSWAPSGGTAATASALCAGSYTCTISSPAGCTHTQSFTITQPTVVSTTSSQVNVTCFGSCNGSATVTPSGGTAP